MSSATDPSSSALSRIRQIFTDIQSLRSAFALMYWDQATLMPDSGAGHRGKQMAVIDRLAHEKSTSPELGRLLDELHTRPPEHPADQDLVRVARQDYERDARVPADFVEKMSSHLAETYHQWKKAREVRDFTPLIDPLKKTLELSHRYSSFHPGFEHVADPLIEGSDPGSTVRTLRPLFSELRAKLVPLVDMITRHDPFDNNCLRREFDESVQLEFGKRVIEKMGYDFGRGRQDLTAHPFMIRFNAGDIRITTRVKRADLSEALFSTIHEAGHALYEMGIDEALEGTPLARGTSSGVHESQSRLWENIVGRSRPFWEHFYPELRTLFPTQLANVSLDEFHRAVNRVERSLIRTDADEVTYNLHVMIRFDLELELLEGRLRVEDLRDAWNARYESDLGLLPAHDGDGCLQDVHWYSGLIGGAFQGYTLGNVMSAQFYEAARRAHPDLDTRMRSGDFGILREWLRKNVHSHGRARTGPEKVALATGRNLEIAPYMRYLEEKYRDLGVALR